MVLGLLVDGPGWQCPSGCGPSPAGPLCQRPVLPARVRSPVRIPRLGAATNRRLFAPVRRSLSAGPPGLQSNGHTIYRPDGL